MSNITRRIEAASGPDREIDAAIWCALNDEMGVLTPDIPFYTASIDAAITIAPEGFNWLVRKGAEDIHAFANVSAVDANMVLDRYDAENRCWSGDMRGHNHAEAATPALALCLAALKARGL